MKMLPYFFGYKKISVLKDRGADLLNLCMKYRYTYFRMGEEDERVFVFCTAFTAARLCIKCRELGLDFEAGRVLGAPAAARLFFSRAGLVLGLFIAALIVYGSQNYLWDIRVSTYGEVDGQEVIDGLADCGFYRGCSLVGFSADSVENLFLRNSESVGWISVNMRGTVAYVEVMEKKTPPKEEPKPPANVVAAVDGVIVEAITYNGLRVVEVGELVREGQLLISGAYGEKTPGLHVTRAAGRVMAKTFRTVSVEIPFEYEEKVETGRVFCEKYLIFFGKEIKVFSNSGNLGVTCDKIVNGKVYSFLGCSLPIGQRDENYFEYKTVLRERDRAEAEALAREELERRIDGLGAEQILGTSESLRVTESSLILECELVCIEDIAKTVEFEFKDQKGNGVWNENS